MTTTRVANKYLLMEPFPKDQWVPLGHAQAFHTVLLTVPEPAPKKIIGSEECWTDYPSAICPCGQYRWLWQTDRSQA